MAGQDLRQDIYVNSAVLSDIKWEKHLTSTAAALCNFQTLSEGLLHVMQHSGKHSPDPTVLKCVTIYYLIKYI